MTVLRLRTARPDAADVQFLWQMLVEAASWRPAEPKISVSEAIADPSHARYVADWGRDGDLGVIAEAAGMERGLVGVVFTEHAHGYGFIDPAVPEISIAVITEMRGTGVGTALLKALIDRARHARPAVR